MLDLTDPTWSRLSVGLPGETGELVAERLRAICSSSCRRQDDWRELELLLLAGMHHIHEAAFAAFPHLVEIARTHSHPGTRFRSMEMASRILTYSLGMPDTRTPIADSLLSSFDAAVEIGAALLGEINALPRTGRERTFEYLAMVAAFADRRPGVAYIMTEMASNGIGCPFECCDESIDLDDLHPF